MTPPDEIRAAFVAEFGPEPPRYIFRCPANGDGYNEDNGAALFQWQAQLKAYQSAYASGSAARKERDVDGLTEDQMQLGHFYSVETKDTLIEKMEQHIERLQAKLPPIRDEQPGRVREG